MERANATIKSIIAKLEQKQQHLGNPDPNWVRLVPATQSAINCSVSNGAAQQSAYAHVFGLEYTIPLMAPPSMVRNAKTITDLEKCVNSLDFRARLLAMGELEDSP